MAEKESDLELEELEAQFGEVSLIFSPFFLKFEIPLTLYTNLIFIRLSSYCRSLLASLVTRLLKLFESNMSNC